MDLTDNVIEEVQKKEGLIASFLDTLPEKALNLGIRIGLALVFFFIGMQLIRLIRKIIRKSMNRAGAEMGVIQFVDSFVKACHVNEENGAHRFSIVTAGRTLVGKEFDQVVEAYKRMHEECKGIELCASHGLLTKEQFEILRKVGVTRCHANIETSRRYFPSICTTHTFEDKLACILSLIHISEPTRPY